MSYVCLLTELSRGIRQQLWTLSLYTPYYTGMAKVLCMDTPVQDIIVGNIPGARGPDTDMKPRDVKYTSQCIVDTTLSTDKQSVENVPVTDKIYCKMVDCLIEQICYLFDMLFYG